MLWKVTLCRRRMGCSSRMRTHCCPIKMQILVNVRCMEVPEVNFFPSFCSLKKMWMQHKKNNTLLPCLCILLLAGCLQHKNNSLCMFTEIYSGTSAVVLTASEKRRNRTPVSFPSSVGPGQSETFHSKLGRVRSSGTSAIIPQVTLNKTTKESEQ